MQADLGLSTRVLVAGPLELTYLDAAGPRIVGLRYKSSANLLASVPAISIPTPYGEYRYIGGHRLWYAPEAMPRSYVRDNDAVTVTELPDGILLQGKREVGTGIQKSIKIHLHSGRPRVILKHTLVNEGLWDVELAPWKITLFRLGSTAILPFQSEIVDVDGVLPDHRMALWPYSKINDPRLRFDDDFIFVSAKPDLPLFKVGVFNARGWIAHWNQGILFRKKFNVQTDWTHPDHGCNAEIYCDEHFMELESIAPLAKLAIGSSASHTENWEFYDELEQDSLPDEAIRLVG